MKEIIEMLGELINEGGKILEEGYKDFDAGWEKSRRWESRCEDLLAQDILPEEAKKFHNKSGALIMSDVEGNFTRHVKAKMHFLDSLQDDIGNNSGFWGNKIARTQPIIDKKDTSNPISVLIKICERFHLIARQLKERYDNRETLKIEDEYDVQNLMHALLRMFFEDIRPEEWTPSYAGSSKRMDFLLKNEHLVIETKKTRKGLNAKELGNQLIIDIECYKKHPDCKTLFCFVYDPEGLISNPKGIENDLGQQEENFNVKVFIAPK
jgi:hypothetical protein